MASMFDSSSDDSASTHLSAMLTEILWFAAGLVIVRLVLPRLTKQSPGCSGKKRLHVSKPEEGKKRTASQAMCVDAAARRYKAVVEAWHRDKDAGPMSVECLQAVTQALVAEEPGSALEELLTHLTRFQKHLARLSVLHAIMEALLQTNQPGLAAELAEAVSQLVPCSSKDSKTRELWLLASAAEGRWDAVQTALQESKEAKCEGAAASAVRGFLKGNHTGLALNQMLELKRQDMKVPTKALTTLLRDVAEHKAELDIPKVLAALEDVPLPLEAITVALVDCLAREDSKTAAQLERRLRELPMSYTAMEPLLKLAAKADEEHALELFQEMKDNSFYLSEGLCGFLLSRAGEAQNLKLVEEVQKYLKSKGMRSLAIYKTLMKVYATSNLLEQACDLYEELQADGLKPDRVMYGCLVKFAVKCGRNDLCNKLFEEIEGGDVQNYMWLIRAAGQAGDMPRTLLLFEKLKSINSDGVDAAIYNNVLDACLSNGAVAEAEQLVQEMRQKRLMTLVTYNTLMKGLCGKQQLDQARALIPEMRSCGLEPDCASFNCLISAAVAENNFTVAWDIFDEMEALGLKPDHYTLSILMKTARKSKCSNDVQRAMALLDRSHISVCSDEVLLNTVVDACIHRKDYSRLKHVLVSFYNSELKPSVQSYGLLIKAWSCLKKPQKCKDLWKEMTVTRGLKPNDVTMSCMLDALVCDGKVEEAAELLKDWQQSVQPNTIVYSTLIKGFASKGDSKRALEIYHQVKEHGLKMNQVAFTALIDAHVRAEQMEQAEGLLWQMEADGIQPNTFTYSSLVKGYSRTGQLDRALDTFGLMLSKGLQADTVIFNTLLDGAVRASRFELCDQLLKDMSKANIPESNFTLSIIIKMWGKRHCLDAAFQAARESTKNSHQRLDSQICTCLISACLHNHAPERAIKAMQEMKSWPNCDGPDAASYSMLVGGLLRAGMATEAAEAAADAMRSNEQPSHALSEDVLARLFKVLKHRGMHAELLHLDHLLSA